MAGIGLSFIACRIRAARWRRSVSYTHLDVYKRQFLYLELGRQERREHGVQLASLASAHVLTCELRLEDLIGVSLDGLCLLRVRQDARESLIGRAFSSRREEVVLVQVALHQVGLGPVSYTHLDVYKRQCLLCQGVRLTFRQAA